MKKEKKGCFSAMEMERIEAVRETEEEYDDIFEEHIAFLYLCDPPLSRESFRPDITDLPFCYKGRRDALVRIANASLFYNFEESCNTVTSGNDCSFIFSSSLEDSEDNFINLEGKKNMENPSTTRKIERDSKSYVGVLSIDGPNIAADFKRLNLLPNEFSFLTLWRNAVTRALENTKIINENSSNTVFMDHNEGSSSQKFLQQRQRQQMISFPSMVSSSTSNSMMNKTKEKHHMTNYGHRKSSPSLFSSSSSTKDSSSVNSNSCVASFEPYFESIFLPYSDQHQTDITRKEEIIPGSKAFDSKEDICPDASLSKVSNLNSTTLSKRSLLLALQEQCPIEFLRENNLNGPMDLILRKKNKSQLEEVLGKWQKLQEIENSHVENFSSPHNALQNTSSSNDIKQKKREEGVETASNNFRCRHYYQLKTTFKVLINRIRIKMQRLMSERQKEIDSTESKTSLQRLKLSLKVLVLHEDYSEELNVYGKTSNFLFDKRKKRNELTYEEINITREEKIFACTLCVFGAVRDMTIMEECALYEACTETKVDLVGCNLGRVAEFTSKIAISLTGHCRGKQLAKAVNKLKVIKTTDDHKFEGLARLPSQRIERQRQHQSDEKELVEEEKEVMNNKVNANLTKNKDKKRKCQVYSNDVKSNDFDTQNKYEQEKEMIRRGGLNDKVIYNKRQKLRHDLPVEGNDESTSIMRRELSCLQQNLHVLAIVNDIPLRDVIYAATQLEKIQEEKLDSCERQIYSNGFLKLVNNLFPLTLLIVNTLWRSRLVSECAKDIRFKSGKIEKDESQETDLFNNSWQNEILLPTLYLIFPSSNALMDDNHKSSEMTRKNKGGYFSIIVRQQDLAYRMSQKHAGAPCQSQILIALSSIIRSQISQDYLDEGENFKNNGNSNNNFVMQMEKNKGNKNKRELDNQVKDLKKSKTNKKMFTSVLKNLIFPTCLERGGEQEFQVCSLQGLSKLIPQSNNSHFSISRYGNDEENVNTESKNNEEGSIQNILSKKVYQIPCDCANSTFLQSLSNTDHGIEQRNIVILCQDQQSKIQISEKKVRKCLRKSLKAYEKKLKKKHGFYPTKGQKMDFENLTIIYKKMHLFSPYNDRVHLSSIESNSAKDNNTISPAWAITYLQHLIYHGVFQRVFKSLD